MAKADWVEIYRSYEAEDLRDEITALKRDLKGSYSAQGVGSVNHQRDLPILQDRLGAATRVTNERKAAGAGIPLRGNVDFSDTGL